MGQSVNPHHVALLCIFAEDDVGVARRWDVVIAGSRELSMMKSEAQPLRITADAEPAKSRFVT